MEPRLKEKAIRLCESVMKSQKRRLGDHYIFTPQIDAEWVNKFYSELVASQPLNKNMLYTMYTIQKCRKDDTLYGPSHGSMNGDITICGLKVNHNWWITNNTFDGEITCKKCLSILKKNRE